MSKLAVLLDRMDESAPVSPFFAKARWLLVFEEETGVWVWLRNRDGDGEWLRQQVIRSGADVLVCGWIDAESSAALTAAGVLVRQVPRNQEALSLLGAGPEVDLSHPDYRRVTAWTKWRAAMEMSKHPLTRDDVLDVVGELDDDKVAAIIATGADMEELVEAYAWVSDESDALADAEKSLTGKVALVYEILMSGEEWTELDR